MNGNVNVVYLVVAGVAVLIFSVFLVLFFSVFRLWIQAMLTNTPISVFDIIGMRLRRVPAQMVVHATIALRQRGVAATAKGVESCYWAYGIDRVTTPTQLADLYVEKGNLEG